MLGLRLVVFAVRARRRGLAVARGALAQDAVAPVPLVQRHARRGLNARRPPRSALKWKRDSISTRSCSTARATPRSPCRPAASRGCQRRGDRHRRAPHARRGADPRRARPRGARSSFPRRSSCPATAAARSASIRWSPTCPPSRESAPTARCRSASAAICASTATATATITARSTSRRLSLSARDRSDFGAKVNAALTLMLSKAVSGRG